MKTEALKSNEEAIAQRAFDACCQAFEESDYGLALIYLNNALNHHSALKYLERLPRIIANLSETDRVNAIEQAINVCSIALFHNDPEDIPKIMAVVEAIKALEEESLPDTQMPDAMEETTEFAKIAERAEAFAWNTFAASGDLEDLQRLTERMAFFNGIIQAGEALNRSELSSAQRKLLDQAPNEVQDTKTFAEYVSIRKSVEGVLDETKFEVTRADYSSPYVLYRLQQANALLSQLWLFNVDAVIDHAIYIKQLADLQKEYAACERAFLERESEPLCNRIEADISEALVNAAQQTSTFTEQIETLQKRYGEIAAKIAEVPLKSKVGELQGKLQAVAEKIADLSKKRSAAYQERCADICRQAIEDYDEGIRCSRKKAKSILTGNPLYRINESLIVPETATLLQMARQLLEAKLSVSEKADFAVQSVKANKMRLEDF